MKIKRLSRLKSLRVLSQLALEGPAEPVSRLTY